MPLTGVVYEIPCQDCERVGETGRSLQKRMTEHKAAVRRGDRNNGITVHTWDEDHRIDWEGANIKEVEQQLWKRKALEAVHIHMQPNTSSLDHGLLLSDVWLPFMKKQILSIFIVYNNHHITRSTHGANSASRKHMNE